MDRGQSSRGVGSGVDSDTMRRDLALPRFRDRVSMNHGLLEHTGRRQKGFLYPHQVVCGLRVEWNAWN